MKNMLKSRWPNDNRLIIYPGILRIEETNNKCLSCRAMNHDDIRNLFFMMRDEIHFYPAHKGKGCCATHLNSYVIGPEGEFYKCWNDMGDAERIIGSIKNDRLINEDLLNKYLISCDCLRDPNCLKCLYLPICVGGCSWYRMKNIFDDANFDLCSLYNGDGILKKCLEYHFYSTQKDKFESTPKTPI